MTDSFRSNRIFTRKIEEKTRFIFLPDQGVDDGRKYGTQSHTGENGTEIFRRKSNIFFIGTLNFHNRN